MPRTTQTPPVDHASEPVGPTPGTPAAASDTNLSTFASRRAAREAREAAGQTAPTKRGTASFKAGIDADNPVLVMTHVQA